MHASMHGEGPLATASGRVPTDSPPPRSSRVVPVCLLVPLFLTSTAPRGASAFSSCRLPSLRGASQPVHALASHQRPLPLLSHPLTDFSHPHRVRASPLSLSAKDSPPAPAAAKTKEGADDAPSSAIYDQEERDRVSTVIETMMSTPADALHPAPRGSLPPDIYTGNIEFLLNEPVYKAVMYARLEQCGTEEELEQLEIVDQLLLDIKKKQRDTWNREKLEVIIGAALEGPTLLDEVLSDMRDTRALDDGLVDFLEALTKQAALNEEAAPSEPVAKKPRKKGEEGPEEGETMLVTMIKIIKDRVIAEIRTRDKPYVRMLAVLLRIDDKEERDALLRSTVLTEEAAQMFENFTLDGIQYMEQHRADWLADERVEKMKGVAREVAAFRLKLHKMRSGSPGHGDERPDAAAKPDKADA